MIRLLRKLAGLCNHGYDVFRTTECDHYRTLLNGERYLEYTSQSVWLECKLCGKIKRKRYRM